MTYKATDVTTMSIDEMRAEIASISPRLAKAFEEMGESYDTSKITVFEGDTASKSAQVHDMNDRLGVLTEALTGKTRFANADVARKASEAMLNLPEGTTRRITPEGVVVGAKTLGDSWVEAKGHSLDFRDTEVPVGIEAKTLFETAAGWAPENTRSGRVVLGATRGIEVLDLLPLIDVGGRSSYPYMVETFANAAAEALEAGQYAEGTLSLAETSENIRKVAVFLPVTDEQIEDEAMARSYLNARLPFMIRQRLDGQVLVGDGTAPNISGFLDRAGINTQAIGADSIFDAIYKGADKVRTVGFAEPDGVIMTPANYQTMRLTTTADGIYILGNPADAGPRRVFGLPVALANALTANKTLVGAFEAHSALLMRSGLEMKVSDSHSDYFIKGKQAIRASMRAGLAVFRESAFTEVTLA